MGASLASAGEASHSTSYVQQPGQGAFAVSERRDQASQLWRASAGCALVHHHWPVSAQRAAFRQNPLIPTSLLGDKVETQSAAMRTTLSPSSRGDRIFARKQPALTEFQSEERASGRSRLGRGKGRQQGAAPRGSCPGGKATTRRSAEFPPIFRLENYAKKFPHVVGAFARFARYACH